MVPVRRIVLDVLKPHEPDLIDFARRVGALDGVEGVRATMLEMDRDVQNVALVVEGDALEFDPIQETVEDVGASVHSVDEVACGERLVDPPSTGLTAASWLR